MKKHEIIQYQALEIAELRKEITALNRLLNEYENKVGQMQNDMETAQINHRMHAGMEPVPDDDGPTNSSEPAAICSEPAAICSEPAAIPCDDQGNVLTLRQVAERLETVDEYTRHDISTMLSLIHDETNRVQQLNGRVCQLEIEVAELKG